MIDVTKNKICLHIHYTSFCISLQVHFFDEDDKYSLGLEWYRRRMPYSFPDQITIEKSPAYFITESVPARIRAMNESIRLLLIVRDPVTRLISDYAQLAANKARKDKALASFEDLVLTPNGQVNTAYKAVRISMYSIFYERWHRVFPRRQIHIVDGDDLIRDPFPEVQRIEEFLGIAHRISKENFFYNKTKGFYCVRNETTEKCLNESKGRRHPVVSDQVIHKLRQFYAPYNRMFFRAAGRDFGWPEEWLLVDLCTGLCYLFYSQLRHISLLLCTVQKITWMLRISLCILKLVYLEAVKISKSILKFRFLMQDYIFVLWVISIVLKQVE